MTRKEAAGVIKFEKACVLRQDTPRCNRDCKKCDLLLPTEDVLTAYDMAIKALEQTSHNDLISRQAAIDAIMCEPTDAHYPSWYAERLERLPSAPPEHSAWVNSKDGYSGHVKCKACFKTYDWDSEAQYFNFCPNCGADMRGEQE